MLLFYTVLPLLCAKRFGIFDIDVSLKPPLLKYRALMIMMTDKLTDGRQIDPLTLRFFLLNYETLKNNNTVSKQVSTKFLKCPVKWTSF